MNEVVERVYLYGTGGHADVVRDVLQAVGVDVAGIFDDDRAKIDAGIAQPGLQIGGRHNLANLTRPIIVTIGDNAIRQNVVEQIKSGFQTAIHPSATIADSVSIGEGSMIIHGVVIQTGTTIGKHVIVNTAASIDHDCQVGDYAHVSPNATLCGNVTVGQGTWIGAGATVIQNMKIGSWCTIGAGAVIIRDVPDGATVVGNPGRIIKQSPLVTNSVKKSAADGDAKDGLLNELMVIVNQVLQNAGKTTQDQLKQSDRLQADLKLDSLDLAELSIRLEAKFGVDVFHSKIPVTIADLCANLRAD